LIVTVERVGSGSSRFDHRTGCPATGCPAVYNYQLTSPPSGGLIS